MVVRIAAIADVHFAPGGQDERPGAEVSDVLLLRAVHRLNRFIRPDLTLLLGDLIDDGLAPDAGECLARIGEIVGLIESPVIAIPGNHDGPVEEFYAGLPRPADFVDVGGVRFVPLVDVNEPQYNARRTEDGFRQMAEAARGFGGPLVAVQHVPVCAPGATECPYNYTNSDEVLAAMRGHGYRLAVGGHFHDGFDLVRDGSVASLAAPTLCRAPFAFLLITLNGDDVHVERHELRMPDELGLFDAHVHTQFAYCSEDMEVGRAVRLAGEFGLAGLAFAEHSGQLYFGRERCYGPDWLPFGTERAAAHDRRLDGYLGAVRGSGRPVALEVDCDYEGRPLVAGEDVAKVDFLIGAIHRLPELRSRAPDLERAGEEFLSLLERFAPCGISILAHPFRVFRRAGHPVPERLFAPTARLLREHGVAAELNFHSNEPPPDFVRMCLEAGVRLALGSDAHNLYEVGEFAPHLALLRECGYDGDLGDVLWSAPSS